MGSFRRNVVGEVGESFPHSPLLGRMYLPRGVGKAIKEPSRFVSFPCKPFFEISRTTQPALQISAGVPQMKPIADSGGRAAIEQMVSEK